uniref:hypothetical protein n=1 Tax=Yoonia sp. TaxID=2212373 RepID=UPI004048CFBF
MAILDPRLLPLLETLAGAGADWLAFEIVDGVRRGREPWESEEQLRAAREKVRSQQPSDRLPADIPVLARPILGDDQIVWAANYVTDRLDGALADLDEGLKMIEAVAESSGNTFRQDDPAFSKARPGTPIEIVLIGEEGRPVDRSSIAVAKEGVASLRNALAGWSREAQGGAIL